MTDNDLERLSQLSYTAAASTGDTPTDAELFGTWAGGDEITANKLNHIDTGIHNAIEGVKILATTVDDLHIPDLGSVTTRVGTIEDTLNSAKGSYSNIVSHLNALDTAVGGIDSAVASAVNTAIGNDTTVSTLNSYVTDLRTRMTNAEANITSHTTSIGHYNTTENEVLNAHSSLAMNADYASLDDRFEAIETNLNSLDTSIGNNSGSSLSGRVSALEAEVDMTSANSRIDILETNLAGKANISDIPTVPTNVSAFTNDAGYLIEHQDISGKANTSVTDALDTRLDAIDGGSAIATTNGTLATRVTALESNSTSATVVIGKSSITYNNDGIPTNIGQEINDDKDYLLQGIDNKYYYWKHINGSWQLISGIGNNEDLIVDIKKYNTIKYTNNENDVSYLYFLEYDYGYDNSLDDTLAQSFANWEANATYIADNYILYNNYIYKCITSNSDTEWDASKWENLHIKLLNVIELPQGGGSVTASIALANLVRPKTINNGQNAIFSFTAITSDGSDITSTKWYVNGVEIQAGPGVAISPTDGQGISGSTFSFNAKGYLRNSTENYVRVDMTSDSGAIFTRSWPIQSNEFSINWVNTIQPIMLYTTNENVNALIDVVTSSGTTNIVEIKVNNNDEYIKTEIVNGSNSVSFSLDAAWFNIGKNVVTAIMKNALNEEEATDEIQFIVLWAYGATTPLVTFAESIIEGRQYEEVLINYYAYNPSSEIAHVSLTVSDGTSRISDVGREMQTYRYISNDFGTFSSTLSMSYIMEQQTQTISDSLTIIINESPYNLSAVSGASRIYNFDPNGHTNSDVDKTSFANVTFSQNFDWMNGGFQQDENDSTAFVVKKGNTITLPRSLFLDNDTNGKTIDICFKITNSDIYDAQAVQDIDNGASPKGLILKANYGELYLSNSAPQVFKYCEENRIDMSILVEGSVNQRLVTVWLDGIPSYAGEYTTGMLYQTNSTNMIIGSEHCDIWIYAIRVYNQALSENNMIQNYIANGVNTTDKIKRYLENDIYDGNMKTTSYYSHRKITPARLHNAMPNLTIVEIEADHMTKTKENPVPGHITITDRIQVQEGNITSYRDQITDLTAASTTDGSDGCIFKVQGTSSVAYARSALNLDIDFKNCKDENQNKIKYKISNSSIGVSYINIKANVASSENANNVCAVDWYNTYQPFKITARKNDASIRDSIEAKPCAVFFKNTSNTALWLGSQYVEPGEQTLYFMGDLCNSKKNTEVFGESGTGEHYTKCCIEDSGNDTLEQKFLRTPVFSSDRNQWDSEDGVDDDGNPKYVKHFEWRMKPNNADKSDCVTAWTDTVTWVASTANNSTKFKNEFDQYFNVESMLYHFLMIEYFAAYDNVSKNTFYSFDWDENADQTKWGGYRWTINKAYDWDTILAYDNDGKPLGDYGIDFGDVENNKSYFNAATNPIWINIQSEYKTELNALYSVKRGEGTWNSNTIMQKWNNYQAMRPHAAMVRDAYVKYIYPYKTNGVIIDTDPLGYDNSYIGRLAGSKIYQRTQYLTYQTSYMDGKYGYYNQNSSIYFRTNGDPGMKNFAVKSYAKTYVTLIKDGQSLGSRKVEKGSEVVFQDINFGDNTLLYFTPDKLIQYIRPLNETQNSVFSASGANKLTEVVLGGEDINRSWLTTSSIVIPSPILKNIDLHNVETFVSSLTLTANTELATIDTRNTGAGIIKFAPYAPLTSVHLNACSGITLSHINTINSAADFTIANGNNLSQIVVEDCNYIIMSTIIARLEEALQQHDGSELSVRLIGLHGETDMSPLELSSVSILEELAKAQSIDAYGIIGNAPCVLTGRVHVPEIGSIQFSKFSTLWPNLDIQYDGEQIKEWTVSFVNDDGTPLKDSNNNNYIQIVRNNYEAHDPLTNNEISIPTKAATAQYTYTFDGWNNLTGTVTANKIVSAKYTSTINYYTVTWYDEPNGRAIKSYTATYGTDMTTYSQPEEGNDFIRVKDTANSVKVFTGWDKPVGKLTENLNVYAQWETSTINNDTASINLTTLKAADIYALSKLDESKKNELLWSKLGNEPIYVQMGRDFNYTSGVNTYDLLNNQSKLVFDGTSENVQIYNGINNANIRPLAINGDWTFAIDYKFLITNSYIGNGNEFVLASCYQNYNNSIQGFKLSLVKSNNSDANTHNVVITWGNNTQIIDYITINPSTTNSGLYCQSYRNIVVLRHIASQPTKLFLYFYPPNIANQYASYGNNIGLTLTVKNDFTWENQSTINTPLILGGNYSGNTETLESDSRGRTLAQGIIYWAKYWDKDLGVKNCTALAQWTHEKIPFALCGYNYNYTVNGVAKTRQLLENTQLNFVALTSIGDRNFYQPVGTIGGDNNYWKASWAVSLAHTLCNNRLYAGLSVAYQSIIKATSIYSSAVDSVGVTSTVNTQDYLYLPTECEVNISNDNMLLEKLNEVNTSWSRPWPWLNSGNSTVITYDDNTGSLVDSNTTIPIYLYRFIGNCILPSTRIFLMSANPYNNGAAWTYNDQAIHVRAGDVWINNGIAYMYVSKEAIDEGEIVDMITINSDTGLVTGGWRKASIWSLRTYNLNVDSYSNEIQFEKILDNSSLLTQPSSSTYRALGTILCPEFSI